MAFGVPVEGTSIVISVAPNTPANSVPPIAGTYVEVGNLTQISKNSTRDKTDQQVFDLATAYTTYGQRKTTYTLNGLKSIGDNGQDALDAAESSNDVIFLKVLWDATNGFSVPCRVGTKTGQGTPGDRAQVSWELGAEDVETVVGTGPIW